MKIPYIQLRAESEFLENFLRKQKEIYKNSQFIGGREIEKLEKSLQDCLSVRFAVTCANGTDAIQLALRAVGIENNDIVFLPDLTFWATFEAIINVGAIPCTVDVSFDDLQMDFGLFTKACEEIQPKAVLLVHLYGWGSKNLENFRKFCQKKQIFLIEDGAQCFGTLYKNCPIYQDSLIATTSFYPSKVFGASGDAGAVFTNDEKIAEKVKSLSNHGRETHYGFKYVGWNSRMDSIQALYLNESFPFLEKRIKSRRETNLWYRKLLAELEFHMIRPSEVFLENGYSNAILLDSKQKKENLQDLLKQNDIGFTNIYPSPISEQIGAKKYLFKKFKGENTRKICQSIINLPLFPYMKEEELSFIEKTLKTFYKKKLTI